jgi:hypothetical protein
MESSTNKSFNKSITICPIIHKNSSSYTKYKCPHIKCPSIGWLVDIYHCWQSHFDEGKCPDTKYMDSNERVIKDIIKYVHAAEIRRENSRKFREKRKYNKSTIQGNNLITIITTLHNLIFPIL